MPDAVNNPAKAPVYVLDSYALLAFFEDEPGSRRVKELLESAASRKSRLFLCSINLGEILYIVERERGLAKAQVTLARINELAIEITPADLDLVKSAAHLKANNPIAYADCFAAALSRLKNAALLTGDPEFEGLETGAEIQIEWLDK